MKNFKLILNLVMVVSSFMFFQCTSEYTPIAGIDGTDGIDGVDGINGSDADAALCVQCHASTHRDPIINAYATSRHATGSSWARGTSSGCAQCHNNEGYIDYLSNNFFETDTDPLSPDFGDLILDVNGDPIPMVNPDGYLVSNPINCTGCHTAHRSFDFTNDGNDYALRNIDPVKLVLDPTVSVDLANASDALGLSNACVTCHQPRPSYPIPAGTGDYTITSFRFGPHHGPQSTMFEGVMGANIVGSTAYPGAGANGDNGHRTGTSCTACHMSESTVATEGGHTWAPSVDACVTCHDTMTALPTETSSWATNMPILEQLLIDKGYISESGNVLGASGSNAGSSNPLVVPVKDAQAIWNYKTLQEDNSQGMHNPKYTDALLKNSIEYLQQ